MKISNFVGALVVALGLAVTGPALAQSKFQKEVATWIDTARESAKSANARYDGLVEKIRSAADPETAEAGLRELVAEANRAAELYGEESALWDDYTKLSAFIDERKEYTLKKVQETGETRWQTQNERWNTNGDRLQEVRVKILQEAVRSKRLAAEADKDLEFILDVLLSEGVEAAIAEMESVYEDLKSVNDNLDAALAAARVDLVGGTGN